MMTTLQKYIILLLMQFSLEYEIFFVEENKSYEFIPSSLNHHDFGEPDSYFSDILFCNFRKLSLESDFCHGGEKSYTYGFMTPSVHDYDVGEPGGLFADVSIVAIGFESDFPI
jgi:hypothetical protein